jgi:hypothetical protein
MLGDLQQMRRSARSLKNVMSTLIRSGLSRMFILVAVAISGGLAMAGPLDPLAFASLGNASLAGGPYTINTLAAGGPTISNTGGVLYTGVISNGVAIFDFNSLSVALGATVSATQGVGTLPVALLSRTTEDIAGSLDVSASGRQTGSGAAPLSDHGANGNTGAYSGPPGVYSYAISGGGGAFGEAGGAVRDRRVFDYLGKPSPERSIDDAADGERVLPRRGTTLIM